MKFGSHTQGWDGVWMDGWIDVDGWMRKKSRGNNFFPLLFLSFFKNGASCLLHQVHQLIQQK